MDSKLVLWIDRIAVIFSFMSFLCASILCLLLWRVRRKQNKQNKQGKQIKKRSVLLTTHVYFMAICDLLISIWAISTYTPIVFDTSFDGFASNVPCFLLALLGQFAAVGSASWYIMISYCLWRILFGHNPLSLSMKKRQKSIKTPNAKLKKPNNIRFRQRGDSYRPHKIVPVKEDESMQISNDNIKEIKDHISPNKYLNLPRTATYNNDPLIGGPGHVYSNSSSSLWSSFSSFSADDRRKAQDIANNDALAFTAQNQIREVRELQKILKRHHYIVWISTLTLTMLPFITGYWGVDATSIDGIDRELECWISDKFWAFSFYSVVTLGVLSAIFMLLYILIKIMKKKCKKWYKEYKRKQKEKSMYDGKVSDASLYGKNERGSSGVSMKFSTFSDTKSPSGKYYRKETMVMKRFGVFVGCYLLCWTSPIIRRYYAVFIEDELNVPDWLILASEMSICIFPMANAIVWYSNPSFRKLISKNLNITIRFDKLCCCCCHVSFKSQINIYDDDDNNDKTQLTEKLRNASNSNNSNNYHEPLRIKQKSNGSNSNKSNKSMSGISSGHTPTTYGSFCEITDYAAYSHFSYPNNTGKNKIESGLLAEQPASFPRFKGTLHSTSDSSSGNNFDDYKKNESESESDSECENESGGTISSMNDMRRIAEFEKAKTSKRHRTGNDTAFSSMTMPSPFSGPVGYSSSLSDEMRQEHERYSSDFTDISGVRSKRNSSYVEFKLNDDNDGNDKDLSILHQHLNTDTLNSEQIKEIAKHCYYGSNENMDFLSHSVSDQKVENGTKEKQIIISHGVSNKTSTSNTNFVNELFSDDDERNKFKNSMDDYEDYGLLEEEEESDDDDETVNGALSVKENHFGIPNDDNNN